MRWPRLHAVGIFRLWFGYSYIVKYCAMISISSGPSVAFSNLYLQQESRIDPSEPDHDTNMALSPSFDGTTLSRSLSYCPGRT